MPVAAVVTSPDVRLSPLPVPCVCLDEAPQPRAMRWAAAIHTATPPAPMLLVLQGDAALEAPALALAQRTAHRGIAAYLLIDPVIPSPHPEWPDAPVTVLSTDESTLSAARLRGWEILDGSVDDAVLDLIGR